MTSLAAFRVTVAGFNERTLRLWAKAGFKPVRMVACAQGGRSLVVLTRHSTHCALCGGNG
jgi:hypothetical protein